MRHFEVFELQGLKSWNTKRMNFHTGKGVLTPYLTMPEQIKREVGTNVVYPAPEEQDRIDRNCQTNSCRTFNGVHSNLHNQQLSVTHLVGYNGWIVVVVTVVLSVLCTTSRERTPHRGREFLDERERKTV
ncbi:hypothetical protein EUGRSUZ_E02328 [Eucalyptus grandis]|uniref:Uncharacterized protein n=2 Tax=Eucalyptus grandis TaxID=71139 RepID=A0ACC3KZ09_EUCGR|nr:hypothetical protein EUGRSUZ_E02328 [Eucalyptus grandis]